MSKRPSKSKDTIKEEKSMSIEDVFRMIRLKIGDKVNVIQYTGDVTESVSRTTPAVVIGRYPRFVLVRYKDSSTETFLNVDVLFRNVLRKRG